MTRLAGGAAPEQSPAGQDAEVVVVGAGPVGLTLAVALVGRGRRVLVLERRAAPYCAPRAVHLDGEAARILQSCGIGAGLEQVLEPAPIYEWRNAGGDAILRLGRPLDGPSGWPASSMFHQPDLEALLVARLARLGGELRRGVEVTGVDQDPSGATVRTTDGPVRAAYAVGCDGAGSSVASGLGLPVHDLGFDHEWLVLDVVPDDPWRQEPINLQICDPARPTTAVSGGPGRRRFELMRLPGEDAGELSTPRRAWELLAPWGLHPANATLERSVLYRFAARWVERWRAGRVLVAGDAAHQMPPFAGEGLCTGLRDAANLAWKLDLVLAGIAGDAILDTYETERLPAVVGATELSVELGRVVCVVDPVAAAGRDAAMAPGVGPEPIAAPSLPPIDEGVVAVGTPGAGETWVQGRSGGQRSDDLHGSGWRLWSIEAGVPAEAGRRLELLDGKVITLPSDRGPGADDLERAWMAERGVVAALVRPDFCVFGTAGDRAGAIELVELLRARITLGTG